MLATVESLRHRTLSPPARELQSRKPDSENKIKNHLVQSKVVQTLKGGMLILLTKLDGSMKEGLGSPRSLPGEGRF